MKLKYITRPFQVKEVDDENGITGIGSVFGDLDSYRDIVLPGAFSKSLAKKQAEGTVIPMLWQHNHTEPIGGWHTFTESKKGLELSGEFVLEVQRAREAQALTKAKVVTGLSIGYTVPKGGSNYDKEKNITFLSEIDLWEVSPVTFPALESAQIDHVRHKMSHGEKLTKREMETLLRDAGLSRLETKKLLAEGYPDTDCREDGLVMALTTLRDSPLKS